MVFEGEREEARAYFTSYVVPASLLISWGAPVCVCVCVCVCVPV